jgi:glutamine amidotransferase
MKIALVDYEMGNLKSVANAFAAAGQPVERVRDPDQLADADGIVLPGVGAFGDGMAKLDRLGFVEPIREAARAGTPMIGLCLGMQLFAESSTEHGEHEGLGVIGGTVARLAPEDAELRVPHVGWNDVEPTNGSTMYRGLEGPTFYFVHSYVLRAANPSDVSGVCDYGGAFAASIERDNLFGTQYHPEKSQRDGLAVIERFLAAC